jgi:hypothetical protein
MFGRRAPKWGNLFTPGSQGQACARRMLRCRMLSARLALEKAGISSHLLVRPSPPLAFFLVQSRLRGAQPSKASKASMRHAAESFNWREKSNARRTGTHHCTRRPPTDFEQGRDYLKPTGLMRAHFSRPPTVCNFLLTMLAHVTSDRAACSTVDTGGKT